MLDQYLGVKPLCYRRILAKLMRILDKSITTNSMIEKQCTTCGITKPIQEFNRRVDSIDGFRNTCKKCSHWDKDYKKNISMINDKICNCCKKVKLLNEFIPDFRTSLGVGTICLECSYLKICRKCQTRKHVSQFPTSDRSKDGYGYRCKECINEQRRIKYNDNEDFRDKILIQQNIYRNTKNSRSGRRERLLKQKYNLSLDDYQNLLIKQNFKCKICQCSEGERGRSYFAVDHDHKTGNVRGLLCDLCNGGLGMFRDDPEILKTAINYLMLASHFG